MAGKHTLFTAGGIRSSHSAASPWTAPIPSRIVTEVVDRIHSGESLYLA